MDDNQAAANRLAVLARTDPIAAAAYRAFRHGTPLIECLIQAADAWSGRCREYDLERVDAMVRQSPAPIVLVTDAADAERIKAMLKTHSGYVKNGDVSGPRRRWGPAGSPTAGTEIPAMAR